LENAFVFAGASEFSAASVEWDVVSGTIHNGYIACARALGIPGLLLFLAAYLPQVFLNAKRSVQFGNSDPIVSDLHGFVFANLTVLTIAIYTGADLNSPSIWFYMTFGALVTRTKASVVEAIKMPESQEMELPLSPRPTAS
jgi:hypothetical protein